MKSFNRCQTRSFLFAISAAFTTLLAAQETSADIGYSAAPGFLKQADRALRRGAPERALVLIEGEDLATLHSRHRADAEGLRCRALLELQEVQEARSACTDAIELDHSRSNWRFFNNLGVAELHLGNIDRAAEAFSQAAARSGNAWEPRRNLSLVKGMSDADRDQIDRAVAARLR